MTSLTSLPATGPSPRTQMNARISAAVAAGSISRTDQTALSSALDGIDAGIAGSKPSGSMKDRIDWLVDQQVSSGALTDDQAAELKQLFAQGSPDARAAVASDGTSDAIAAVDGANGPGGPRGPGGPPPGPPPQDDDADSDASTNTTTTSSSASAATTTTTTDQRLAAMEKFLETLRRSVDATGTYDSSKAASTATSGMIFTGVA